MFWLKIIVIALIISGCTPTGYEQSYILIEDPSNFSDAEALNTGQQPKIFGSDDFIRDAKILASKKYTLLGMSLFCGAYDRIDNALKQAKK